MATVDLEMKVSVEKAVHDAIRTCLQDICDTHGLRVDSISARWIDVSSPGEIKMLITDLSMQTCTKA